MFFKHEDANQFTERISKMAYSLVEPFLYNWDNMSSRERKDRVSDLLLAMMYAQTMIANHCLDVTPEEFGEHMGQALTDTLRLIKNREGKEGFNGTGTSTEKESVWD